MKSDYHVVDRVMGSETTSAVDWPHVERTISLRVLNLRLRAPKSKLLGKVMEACHLGVIRNTLSNL